jgi:hypothetical protein
MILGVFCNSSGIFLIIKTVLLPLVVDFSSLKLLLLVSYKCLYILFNLSSRLLCSINFLLIFPSNSEQIFLISFLFFVIDSLICSIILIFFK